MGSFEWNSRDGKFYFSTMAASRLDLSPNRRVGMEEFLDKVSEHDRTAVSGAFFLDCSVNQQDITLTFETAENHRLIKLTAVPVLCRDGSVSGIKGIMEDITEQVKIERERDMLFLLSRDGIAILDMDTYFKDVNGAYEAMTGYGRDELLKMSCLELTHKDDIPATVAMMKTLVTTGYCDKFEKRCIRKDGLYINVQMNLILLPNGTIMITTRDVSDIMEYQQKLSRNEQNLRQLFEVSPIPMCLTDDRGKPILLNRMFTDVFGYDIYDLNTNKAWWTLAFPNEQYRIISRERWKKYTVKIAAGETPQPIQATVTCKNGTKREIVFLYSVMDEMSIIAFYDITERVAAENRLQEYISIVDDNVLILRTGNKSEILTVSNAFCRLSGYGRGELVGMPAMMLNHEDFLNSVQPVMMETIYAGKQWSGEIKKINKNGEEFWVQSVIQPVFENGIRMGFLSISTDITDKKRIEVLSVTDKLTGIYNRIRLDEVLSAEYVRFKRYGQIYSLIMFDIDFFKKVNDTYGHLVGDEVLKSLANLIKSSIRESDVFGRWGGEEFLIVCSGTDVEGAYNLASKLRRKVELFEFPSVDRVTCSFGVAQIDDAGTDNMVKRADDALYRAKLDGRNRVEK
ncbi:MAG: PAS domain S-box protein [Deferribacterales bacterium]